MDKHYFLQFAQTYGEHAYGECSYNQTTGTCGVAGTGSTPASGGLVNAGFIVAVIVTLACLVVFVGLLVRFWRRPKAVANAETGEVVEEDATQKDA